MFNTRAGTRANTRLSVSGAATPERLSPAYAAYTTAILACVAMLSSADRNILSVLLVPIQNDLQVSDTAMGALSGMAFTLVYAVFVLPVARLADTGNRRNLIAVAAAFWSLMTLVSGFATSYLTLLIARMGVAAGEAGGQPAQASMVGDLYPPKRRGIVFGFIMVGTLLGISVGSFIAGTLSQIYNWHVSFMALALPGLVVAALVYFTVPEPSRGMQEEKTAAPEERRTLLSSMRYLLSVPTLRLLFLGQIFIGVAFSSILTWFPAFLIRVHHMNMAEMSFWYGLSMALGPIFSNTIGGHISDVMAARGAKWRLYCMSLMLVLAAPFFAASVLAGDIAIVLIMMLIYSVTSGGVIAIGTAAGLDFAQPRLRGLVTAASGLCISAIGGTVGPVIFGAVNDALKPAYGDEALRYTLLIAPILMTLGGLAFYLGGATGDKDANAARATGPGLAD